MFFTRKQRRIFLEICVSITDTYNKSNEMKYKDFLASLRLKIELVCSYIVINNDITPNLFEYLNEFHDIEFKDGHYHTYCGKVKEIVNNFIQFWMEIINDCIRVVDRYNYDMTKSELLELVDRAICIHAGKHLAFSRQYLPAETPEEQEMYSIIQEKYNKLVDGLIEMKKTVENFDTQEQVTEFTRKTFEISLQRKTGLMELTHTYISLVLADKLFQIRTSLEDTLFRIQRNLRERQEEREEMLNSWVNQMYEKNKERIILSRQDRRDSEELAEVDAAIAQIRENVEEYQQSTPITRLDKEVIYWQRRLIDYTRIETTIKKLKAEKENLSKQREIYDSYKCMELPGSKLQAWENIGINLKNRIEFVNEKYLEAAKSLLTFFAVRGQNRIFYKDHIGTYILDEYGHQVYVFNYGKKMCHVNCDGSFKEVDENEKYYYDNNGRYIIENGERIYQCAPCTSKYRLNEYDLLEKITPDCGHSDRLMPRCKLELKDPMDVQVIPIMKPIDIKNQIPTEVVNYLWGAFAHILPEALIDMKSSKSRIPLNRLAYALLHYKYNKTFDETKFAKDAAEKYRQEIYQKRKEKDMIASKAWKSKQVKRRKPEESDDTVEVATYEAYTKTYENITNYFYLNEI